MADQRTKTEEERRREERKKYEDRKKAEEKKRAEERKRTEERKRAEERREEKRREEERRRREESHKRRHEAEGSRRLSSLAKRPGLVEPVPVPKRPKRSPSLESSGVTVSPERVIEKTVEETAGKMEVNSVARHRCRVCTQTFSRRDTLRLHEKKAHHNPRDAAIQPIEKTGADSTVDVVQTRVVQLSSESESESDCIGSVSESDSGKSSVVTETENETPRASVPLAPTLPTDAAPARRYATGPPYCPRPRFAQTSTQTDDKVRRPIAELKIVTEGGVQTQTWTFFNQ